MNLPTYLINVGEIVDNPNFKNGVPDDVTLRCLLLVKDL